MVGYNSRYTHLHIPRGPNRHVGLTLPRSWLTHGYAKYKNLLVEVDYDTLRHDGQGFVAEVTIKGVPNADQ